MRTFQVPGSAWLAFIFRPTGSFMEWAAAAPIRQATSLPIRLNTIRTPILGRPRRATYPDNMVNNIACGVLTDAGTPYIYCAGGSVVSTPTVTTGRVFRYDPVTDTISPVAAPWPAAGTTVIPGGFTVFQNKLYILGGFDTVTGGGQGINQIWEFTPSPAGWVQKPTVLPVPLGYIPTTTIGSLIYTGGGSDITAGALTDTTNSFVYNPVANTIGTIAAIPRATGETRALNFNGLMLVMGGGRTAPNPSNEVDAYDPAQ